MYTNTKDYIWRESPNKVFSKVTQCSYTGCIHNLIC